MNVESSGLNFGDKQGKILTFVVGKQCQLKCYFCIVRQRREISGKMLSPSDFVQFIRQSAQGFPILSLSIVGYEPLMANAMPYTRAILNVGEELGVPCSLVTNGIRLKSVAPELRKLPLSNVVVSLDSALPVLHDKLRGQSGAWKRTVIGIREALKQLDTPQKLVISSVLTPSNLGELQTMPSLIAELGIGEWFVTPEQRIGGAAPRVGNGGYATLGESLLSLAQAATGFGIKFMIDDELSLFDMDLIPASLYSYVRKIPRGINIVRLSPSGYCSVDRDILTSSRNENSRWRPEENDAAEFVLDACGGSIIHH